MSKTWIGLGIGLLFTACTVIPGDNDPTAGSMPSQVSGDEMVEVSLEDFGPAPELENEVWLNTDEPLRLASLSGQVVLLDMWTFG